MTKEQVDAIPRKEAGDIIASVPAGRGYDDRVTLAVAVAMNLEWWRGYYAGQADAPLPRFVGVDLASGPDITTYNCSACGSSLEPCEHARGVTR